VNASSNNQSSVNEMFTQAAQMFQSAMEAGIKIQEESTKSFTEMINRLGSPQQWQQQAQAAMEQTMAAVHQNVDEAIKLMNENTRTSLELLEKAFSAQQSTASGDGQTRTREIWETAIGSLRRNTEVIMQANNRLLESWKAVAEMIRQQEAAKTE
jgi:hypothetical protein